MRSSCCQYVPPSTSAIVTAGLPLATPQPVTAFSRLKYPACRAEKRVSFGISVRYCRYLGSAYSTCGSALRRRAIALTSLPGSTYAEYILERSTLPTAEAAASGGLTSGKVRVRLFTPCRASALPSASPLLERIPGVGVTPGLNFMITIPGMVSPEAAGCCSFRAPARTVRGIRRRTTTGKKEESRHRWFSLRDIGIHLLPLQKQKPEAIGCSFREYRRVRTRPRERPLKRGMIENIRRRGSSICKL